jgi:hypothetical protein
MRRNRSLTLAKLLSNGLIAIGRPVWKKLSPRRRLWREFITLSSLSMLNKGLREVRCLDRDKVSLDKDSQVDLEDLDHKVDLPLLLKMTSEVLIDK